MSDPLDFIRQNPDIKEQARTINHMQTKIKNLEDQLRRLLNLVDSKRITETRTKLELVPDHTHPLLSSSDLADADSTDSDAFHANADSEVQGVLTNVTPAAADEFIIEDASDSNNKKAVLFSALEGAIDHDALTNFEANEHFTEASISHDNITGVSASDHHNQSHTITDHSDQDQTVQTSDNVQFGQVDVVGSANPRVNIKDTTNNALLELIATDTTLIVGSDTDHDLLFRRNNVEFGRLATDWELIKELLIKVPGNSDVGVKIQRASSSGRSQFQLLDENGGEAWRCGMTGAGSDVFAFYESALNNLNVLELTSAGASDPRVKIPSVNSTTGTNCVITSGDEIFKDSTSSKRFKKNIRPLEIKTEDLYKLDLISFEFNDKTLEPDKTWFGITAEQCYKYFPEIIAMDKGGKPESIMHQYLPYLMLDLIQKQNNRIDDLESRLEVLESAS